MEESPLQFPCTFPLKVMGKDTGGNRLFALVSSVVEKHLTEGDEATYHTRSSSGGKFISVTATFQAKSRDQLDAIYRELNGHELVLMTL